MYLMRCISASLFFAMLCFFTFCVAYIWLCKNAVFFVLQKTKMLNIFLWKMWCWTFSKGKCSAKQNVTNVFDAVQKCIWCKNAFLRTFYEVKCSASHFVTQNVTNAFDAALTFCWCLTFSFGKCSANQNVRKRQNAVFFALQKTKAVQKCCVFCFAKNKDAVQKCIWCVHFVLQKCIFASTKCYKCIWCYPYILFTKC